MYLHKLFIRNFRTISSASFNFKKGSNSIIGENDSGKTNSITALRLLLDDSFNYKNRNLKSTDFNFELDNWKGHWIVISALFTGFTDLDYSKEITNTMLLDQENDDFMRNLSNIDGTDIGNVSLYIRPNIETRRRLYNAESSEELQKVRDTITITDYEFYYTAKSPVDFTNDTNYALLTGDLMFGEIPNPDNEDAAILGNKVYISDINEYVSVIHIDALRDVLYELKKGNNPIVRIMRTIEDNIDPKKIEEIGKDINTLNRTISSIKQVGDVSVDINNKLIELLGLIYNPKVLIESELSNDLRSLSKSLSLKTERSEDLSLFGLGHLNMVYISLKLVEFELNRNREILNIMIVEEPEAHIHTHIQKTLFSNLSTVEKYTQIIMTTHSAFLSESSEIARMNIMKKQEKSSIVMTPTNGLNDFGKNELKLSNLDLVSCIERYLDSRRSNLMFAKSVILVEGDGEELLIPQIVLDSFGISLDEIGISIINVGSTSFEYIASLFSKDRIQRYCAILTDLDKQIVNEDSTHYKKEAEQRGENRKIKLHELFDDNKYVDIFYAETTLETEFAELVENRGYVKEIIKNHYKTQTTIDKHCTALEGDKSNRANSVLTIANAIGKGWYAILLGEQTDNCVQIPNYIIRSLAFAVQENIDLEILIKILANVLDDYNEDEEIKEMKNKIENLQDDSEKINILKMFAQEYSGDNFSKLLIELSKITEVLWDE